MPTWLIIVLVVLVLLAIGGYFANRRRLARTRPAFENRLAKVNRDLAAALAEDRGWQPERLEAAARAAWAEQRPGEEPEAVTIYEVLDRPGEAGGQGDLPLPRRRARAPAHARAQRRRVALREPRLSRSG